MKTIIQLSDHFTYKKLFRFCLPPIIMMIFTSIYGVVDGLFVSNFVGKVPFAAINLIYPFVMILGGVGFMIGTGGSAWVAKTLGEGDAENACRYFTMMIKLTTILGIVLSVFGIALLRPISCLLGATKAMVDDCVMYGRIVLGFNTAFMLQNVFQTFLTTAEKPKLGLAATVAAGITNMTLDALFIAVFKWGVAGAALATMRGRHTPPDLFPASQRQPSETCENQNGGQRSRKGMRKRLLGAYEQHCRFPGKRAL